MKYALFLLVCIAVVSWGYETPSTVKSKYRTLYSLKPVVQADGSIQFHQGRLFRRGGINVLHLKGDSFEMGFQHGRLLQEQVQQGALPQIAKSIENSIRNIIPNIPVVTDSAVAYFYKHYTDAIIESTIKTFGGDRDTLLLEGYGLSEGSGLDLDMVLHGAFAPESLQTILGDMTKQKTVLSPVSAANECTDFVARGSLTPEGEMIIGRNTDYPLNGFFEKYTTVIYYEPTDGAQKYMAVTSAGLHTAGVIGFNEAGIFLGVHTVPTADVSTNGVSIFIIAQEALRHAKTFDEVVSYFKTYHPAAGWTYTLASVKENRVAAIEISHKNVSVREVTSDVHVQSNHFVSPLMATKNLDLNASINEDSRARKLRGEQLLSAHSGTFGPQDAVDVLSDKWDPYNQEVRGLGNVIAVHTTLSSAVFDPQRGRVFVANTGAPISLGTYVEFPLIQNYHSEIGIQGGFETLENKSFYYDAPLLAAAEQKFIDAKSAFENELNPNKTRDLLKEAVDLDPGNPGYSFVRGIMALKAVDFADAEEAFRHCVSLKYLHYRLASQYYLGRIWAHQGDREKAKQMFKAILKQADPLQEKPLIVAVKKSLQQLSRVGVLKISPASLTIFMPEADMLKY